MIDLKPYTVAVPESAIDDLKNRLRNARWSDEPYHLNWETGPPPEFVHSLCDHWLRHFDWRDVEVKINKYPQVTTDIDGVSLYCIHKRSSHPNAVPIILIHGWPGAYLEYLALIEALVEPASTIGSDEKSPAFHVVVPCLPGYGFSTTKPGVNPQKIAAYFVELMQRLGYTRFLVQGGNWGSLIGTEMARQHPDKVLGLHLSSIAGTAAADGLNRVKAEELSWITEHTSFPHFNLISQKPASPAYGLNDSPIGLAAWISEKLYDWADNRHCDGPALSVEQMLGIISLYWFTGTIGSSMRLYYEFVNDPPQERYVETPTAAALFPNSIAKIPRAWAEEHYNIQRWTVIDKGGHFPAMEVPEIMLKDIREFSRSIDF